MNNGAPKVNVGGRDFAYAEDRTGHRAIKIWTAGSEPVTYRIDPDPHGDARYEKKTARFYLELATAIGTLYLAANPQALPPFGVQVDVDLTGRTYTLNEP